MCGWPGIPGYDYSKVRAIMGGLANRLQPGAQGQQASVREAAAVIMIGAG
jgi:hypothetical protein